MLLFTLFQILFYFRFCAVSKKCVNQKMSKKMSKKNTQNITFNISLEEANLIFKALGKQPFAEVFELIGKLNEQANQQLVEQQQQTDPQ